MKRILLTALAFGAAAVVAPAPAFATHTGGCSFASNNDPSGEVLNPDTQTGAIVATVVGADSIQCWIQVNGSDATPRVTFSGSNGVTVGSEPVTYTAPEGSITELCELAPGHTTPDCGEADEFTFPPDEFWDAIDLIFATLDPAFGTLTQIEKDYVDPQVCPVLKSLAPLGDPAVLGVTAPDGDVYLDGLLFWDCPEYETA